MTFDEYYQKLLVRSKVSDVKIAILKRLWVNDGEDFPKPWVTSSELLQLTGQKYFDRRVRELRNTTGCDIESEYRGELRDHAWRLTSEQLSSPKNREYLTEKQKRALFEKYDYTCAVCGSKTPPGLRGLQADHKIPLLKSGSNDISNWQPLCVQCNVGNRPSKNGQKGPIFLPRMWTSSPSSRFGLGPDAIS